MTWTSCAVPVVAASACTRSARDVCVRRHAHAANIGYAAQLRRVGIHLVYPALLLRRNACEHHGAEAVADDHNDHTLIRGIRESTRTGREVAGYANAAARPPTGASRSLSYVALSHTQARRAEFLARCSRRVPRYHHHTVIVGAAEHNACEASIPGNNSVRTRTRRRIRVRPAERYGRSRPLR